MNQSSPLFQFIDNPIVWVILALALSCYVLHFNFLLAHKDHTWRLQTKIWLKVLPILLSLLPLLGLLGTITGLLATFRNMSISGGLDQQALLSSGIADALFTTQLGLVTLIPGLILLTSLRRLFNKSLNNDEK